MKRYRLTGMLDSRGIEPDPEGPLVRWEDVSRWYCDPVFRALAEYTERLEAWDARSHEGVHSFEGTGLDDGLRSALRAERAKRDAHHAAIAEGIS